MQMTKKTEEKQTARDANDTKHVTQKRNRAGTEAQHRKPNRGDAQKNAYKKQGKSLVNPLTYWTLSNLYHELKNQITSTLNFQNSLIYPLGWF
jgi:hypothetical protein